MPKSSQPVNAGKITTTTRLDKDKDKDKLVKSKITYTKPNSKLSTDSNNMSNRNNASEDKNKPNTINYAKVAAFSPKLNRDNAIVLDVIEELNEMDYIETITSICGSTNILAAFKMSNNRFYIFLATKEMTSYISAT